MRDQLRPHSVLTIGARSKGALKGLHMFAKVLANRLKRAGVHYDLAVGA
jgi:hypothetical protein